MRALVAVGVGVVVPLVAACVRPEDADANAESAAAERARMTPLENVTPEARCRPKRGCPAPQDAGADADATATSFSDDFESFTVGEVWPEGSVHGAWRVVFNGFGQVGIVNDGSKVASLRPQASTAPSESHSSLVTSTITFGDLDFGVRVRTAEQLRVSPNPWEVAWVLWHYTDNTHFYYLALKPNGWELGKEDPAYPGAQRFLATSASPSFSIGSWRNIRVRQSGDAITISVDGTALTTFTDRERPYRSGALGLYTEDAEAHYDDIVVVPP